MAVRHIITPEYPPKIGGVADYTRLVAEGLADAGDEVHVWAPDRGYGLPPQSQGISVRLVPGDFGRIALKELDQELGRHSPPRRILVQWVPHGYGWRGVNLPFCWWLARRAKAGDRIEVMFHEIAQGFRGKPWQYLIAAAQRGMVVTLLQAAERVWVSTPTWEKYLRPLNLSGKPIRWLPVPSTVPSLPQAVVAADCDFGHFSTYTAKTAPLLVPLLTEILKSRPASTFRLIGAGSDRFLSSFIRIHPEWRGLLTATGTAPIVDVRGHIQRCAIMLQPFAGGITARNTSVLACLANGRPTVTNSGELTEPFWAESGAIILAPSSSDACRLSQEACSLIDDEARQFSVAERANILYNDIFAVRHAVDALQC